MTNGQFTKQEIFSQPEAWSAALEVVSQNSETLNHLWRENRYESLMLTGCGSTYYLAYAGASLLQESSDIYARALPASEIWLHPRSSFRKTARTLLIAVSRSGATSETLNAVNKFRAEGNGQVLTISCYPDEPLAKMGDVNLVLPSGQEQSVAQTRAFSVMYLAVVALNAMWNNQPKLLDELHQLPGVLRGMFEKYSDMAGRWGRDLNLDRHYFLGSGTRYGLAAELSLKMKEMTLSHSEPFHFMEFRHGPQSMANPQTLMVGLVSESNKSYEMKVLNEMRERGANIFAQGESDTDVIFASGLSETANNVLYLPLGQWLAFERAIAKGLNPDRPNNLESVVRL
ncbi:MAG: SIS domain-containing protein [Anaerolineae bacterium]